MLHSEGLTLSRIKGFLTSKEHSKTFEAKAQELLLSVAHRYFQFQKQSKFPQQSCWGSWTDLLNNQVLALQKTLTGSVLCGAVFVWRCFPASHISGNAQ